MAIKSKLVKMAARITGRKCSQCVHNWNGTCCHPDGNMFIKCWNSLRRPGFKAVTLADVELGRKICEAFKDGVSSVEAGNTKYKELHDHLQQALSPLSALTPEEEYQLQKIKVMLEEAEDMARESGLITED